MALRRSHRKSFQIDCQIVRESNFSLVATETLDLSTTGVRVHTKGQLLTGESVIVSIQHPQSARYIDAVGTVARVQHGRRRGERGTRSLGIEFESLDDDSQRCLDELLARRAS